MRTDIVSIEPETVQFNRENTQIIKIINNTSNYLENFFFALFNLQKFSFSPDSFSLAPNEHKLITITLKTKSSKSVSKQFAYLKSYQINKRITLLINNFQSPTSKTKNSEQGIEDINTLSSREYRDIQTAAIQKIIQQKQAYIARLERQAINRSGIYRTQQSNEKTNVYRKELDDLQLKNALLQNQKDDILRENALLHQKFEQYRKICEGDLKNYEKANKCLQQKSVQIHKLNEQIQFLQQQGNQFLKKITQKQQRIKELQQNVKKLQQQSTRQNDKKVQYLEQKLEQQKRNHQISLRNQDDRVRQLEISLQNSTSYRDQSMSFEKELRKKDQEIKNLMKAIEEQRISLKNYESDRKKAIKLELMNESLNQKTSELTSRIKQVQKINENLRQELLVYKSRVAENDVSSDKMAQYLQIALQSCRSENEALKKSKRELEKSLQDFMMMNRQTHDNAKDLNLQITKYKEQIHILQQIKQNLEKRNQETKQEHHIALMQLKSQNIELLEKVSLSQSSKREELINRLQTELKQKTEQIIDKNVQVEEVSKKIQQLEMDNQKLSEKVKKYKKQARKELRSINDTAIDQLKRVHDEKKQLTKKIIQLQDALAQNTSIDQRDRSTTKNKSRSKSKIEVETQKVIGRLRNQGSQHHRKIGIKDQRKQLSQIHSNGTNIEQIYSELAELKQLNRYLISEQERINRIYNLDLQKFETYDQTQATRPIYRVIKFFKQVQNRLRGIKDETQSSMDHIKQIEYMRGRLKELESIKDQKKIEGQNQSSLNLNKTKEYCGQLLQFIRQEMKNQFKKLNDTLRMNEDKYQILKKKIYEEYRSKIIEMLNKKDKTNLPQIESTLQRFIDGLSNMSHKEALLHKQTRLKMIARKQCQQLKEKVHQLNHLLQTKKGCCTRDPLKIVYNENQVEWQQNLKRQAEFLTLSAENQRMKEEFGILNEDLTQSKSEIRRFMNQIQEKSQELLKLKKNHVQLQTNFQIQLQKQHQIIDQSKRKIMEMTKINKDISKTNSIEREYNILKEDVQRKKEIIKNLREKQKMLNQILEQTHRQQEKSRKRVSQQSRALESMRDLKDNNRELRNQNGKLKQKISKLQEQLQKKNIYLKNLKGDVEQNRIKAYRKDQAQSQKLKEEIKKITDQLRKTKQELQKLKKKKDKDLSALENEINTLKNEGIIQEKSLQSIIRALVETIRKLYSNLRIIIKKKYGKELKEQQKLFQITSKPSHVDAIKVYEMFEECLNALQDSP